MAPSLPSPAASPDTTKRYYLLNCPFEEKDAAKRAGAKWDAKEGRWFVSSSQRLEYFNRWHPNGRKYLECAHDEKDDAKQAGARWDASFRQWYIDLNQWDESKFARWLPSSSASKTKARQLSTSPSTSTTSPKKTNRKGRLATIPRINEDMTVAQLQTECRSRDPSVKGFSSKNKLWLLDHLLIGTPWISAASSTSTKKTEAKDSNSHSPKKRTIQKELETKTLAFDNEPEPAKKKKAHNKPKAKVSNSTTTAVNCQKKQPAPKTNTGSVPASNVVLCSRITNNMTMVQLRDEAKARRLDPKATPELKADLLHILVKGSIHVHESTEYRAYLDLLERVQMERTTLFEASLQNKQAAEARRGARMEYQRQKDNQRREEVARQEPLHVHSFPRVHPHALARHEELMMDGVPRDGTCERCDGRGSSPYNSISAEPPPLYSCDGCNWDICQTCFDDEHKSEEEKEQVNLDSLNKWSVATPDSTRWTVGVVPEKALIHLPNSSTDSHNNNNGTEPQGYK